MILKYIEVLIFLSLFSLVAAAFLALFIEFPLHAVLKCFIKGKSKNDVEARSFEEGLNNNLSEAVLEESKSMISHQKEIEC